MANSPDPADYPLRDGARARLARELSPLQKPTPVSDRSTEASAPSAGDGAQADAPTAPGAPDSAAFADGAVDGAPSEGGPQADPDAGSGSTAVVTSRALPIPLPTALGTPWGRRLRAEVEAEEALVPADDAAALFPTLAPPRKLEARRAVQEKSDVLKRGWKLLLGITALVVALTVAALLVLGPQYESHAILLIKAPGPNEVQTEIMGRFVDTPGGGEGTRRVLNQAIILQQSPAIAERTAARLMAVAEERGAPFPIFGGVGDQPLTPRTLGALIQESYVSVEPAGLEVDAVRVGATGATAEEAHLLAQFYMEEYRQQSSETSREFIERTKAFLAEQRDQRRAELATVEGELSDYRRRRGAVDLGTQAQQSIQQVAALEAQLDQARVTASMREQSLQALEAELAELQPRLAQRLASGVQGELAGVEAEIVELEGVLNDIYVRRPQLRANPALNPDVMRYEAQLADLRARRARLSEQFVDEVVAAGGVNPTSQTGEEYLSGLRQRISEERVALQGALAEATALRQRLSEERGQLLSIPGRAQTLAEIERARYAAEQSYQFLENRLREAEVAAESEFGVTQVVREPQVPLKPSRPNWPLMLPLALVLGLLLGTGAAFARYRVDTVLYAPGDLAEYGFPVLSVVPELRAAGAKSQAAGLDPALVALTAPLSAPAEAYRHLQASLYPRLSGAPSQTRSLLVTSPEAGAGKSVTAINLAVSAAQAGLRTLIVDADLRRPSVHAYLGLGPNPPAEDDDAGMNMVYWNTSVRHLFALTVYEPAERPEQLWSGEEIYRLVDRLSGTFDLIVFDAPAALVAADASFFAVHTDATLLVAESGVTTAEALTQTAAELAGAGGYLAGVVLNRFDPRRAAGYGQTFGYRYRAPADASARTRLPA